MSPLPYESQEVEYKYNRRKSKHLIQTDNQFDYGEDTKDGLGEDDLFDLSRSCKDSSLASGLQGYKDPENLDCSSNSPSLFGSNYQST